MSHFGLLKVAVRRCASFKECQFDGFPYLGRRAVTLVAPRADLTLSWPYRCRSVAFGSLRAGSRHAMSSGALAAETAGVTRSDMPVDAVIHSAAQRGSHVSQRERAGGVGRCGVASMSASDEVMVISPERESLADARSPPSMPAPRGSSAWQGCTPWSPSREPDLRVSWGRIWKINLADLDHPRPFPVKLRFQIRPQFTTGDALLTLP